MRTLTLRAQFANKFATAEKWNQVFPMGTWHGANLAPIGGSITIDMAMLNELVANWQQAGRPPLPIYKTHLHLEEDLDPLDRVELEKSYGYLTDFRVTPDGLEAQTEWTPAGKAIVDAGEFAFWSPEWQPRFKDRRTGETKGWWLSAVALCSNPFFHSMPPVAASADDAESTDTNPNKEQDMTPEQKKRLKAALKLSDETTDEDLVAAYEKHMMEKVATAKSATDASITAAVKEYVEPLKAQLEASTKRSADLEAQLLERDVDAMISKLMQGDGKMGRAVPDAVRASAKLLAKTASTKEAGLKAATELVEALPCTVPLQVSGIPGAADAPLTAEAAHKKIAARAEELRAKGDPTPTVTAMREMPRETLIAEGRTNS